MSLSTSRRSDGGAVSQSRAAMLARRAIPQPIRRLFAGFWAVPVALAALGCLLSYAMTWLPAGALDLVLPKVAEQRADPDSLRTTLSVVATSVMSLTSIVFSLTFVALSITSQQLSPRMLDFVLRARIVQLMIGLGLAAFLFATISLTLEQGDARHLQIAAWLSLLLATMTVVTVVAFVHKMSAFMRPDEMVARRGDALVAALGRQIARAEEGHHETPPPEMHRIPLRVPNSGYVGAISIPQLVQFATENDIVVITRAAEGWFFLKGEVFCELAGGAHGLDREATAAALLRIVGLSDRPEVSAGAVYEARALAEGAIKALSPGINDPGTALSCINRLAQATALIIEAGPPPNAFADAEGKTRLFHRGFDVRLMVERALRPVCEHALGDAEASRHLATLLRTLERRAEGDAAAALGEIAAYAERGAGGGSAETLRD